MMRLFLLFFLLLAGAATASPPPSPAMQVTPGTWLPNGPCPGGAPYCFYPQGQGTNPTVGVIWQATGAVAASSHAAGTSVGGLTAITVARNAGLGGWITGVELISPGGNTGSYVVRIYQSNPAGGAYTCTDNAAFVDTAAAKALLLFNPFVMTPTAPAVTTGDSATYAAQLNVAWPFVTSTVPNIYVCVVTVAADTLDESNPLLLSPDVVQN